MLRRLPRSVPALCLLSLLAACGQVRPPSPNLAVTAPINSDIVAWGNNGSGQTNVPALPAGVSYIGAAAGLDHSLALRSDGQVVAWGSNSSGQTNVPGLPAGVGYTAVADGYIFSLALRSDGQIVAWGYNADGQTDVPALPEGVSYTAVAGGDFHSLAVRSDGQVVAWGRSTDGQINVPALPEGVSYTDVAGGDVHSLALRSDGQVVAWGDNDFGQTNVPALPAGVSYIDVEGGAHHSLALRSDGRAVAWGGNSYGQTDVPALPAGVSYTAVAGGLFHSLAVRSDGRIVAWGYNALGQNNVPTLPEGSKYLGVAGGGFHSLAIADSLPPVLADTYTLNFQTAPLNRILYNVKVGQGVTYSGTGTAVSDTIRVDGYQYKNGKRFGSNQVKAISVSGDNVLTVVKAGTNTPNLTGGELDIKPGQGFGGPSQGKNGLVTLKSITVDGVSTNNAKLILYGNGQPIKTISLSKTPSQTLTLNEPNVGFIQVRANDSFTVDDVVFEVPVSR